MVSDGRSSVWFLLISSWALWHPHLQGFLPSWLSHGHGNAYVFLKCCAWCGLSALFGKAWTLSAFITVKNHGPPLADPSCVLLLPCDPGRGSSCTEQELWISTWARPGQKLFFFFLRITMHRNSPHLILSLYILSNEFFKVKCVNSRTHANNSMSCLTKDLAAQVIG